MNQSATTPRRWATASSTRPRHPAHVEEEVGSRCCPRTRWTGSRARRSSAPDHQDVQGARREADEGGGPRPRHPRGRDLGRRERQGQGALPGHRRAGRGLGAAWRRPGATWSSLSCHSGEDGACCGVTPCPSRRTPTARSPSRSLVSTRCSSDTRTWRSRSARDQHRHRQAGAGLGAPLVGHARVRDVDSTSRRSAGAQSSAPTPPATTRTPLPRTPRSPSSIREAIGRHSAHLRQLT